MWWTIRFLGRTLLHAASRSVGQCSGHRLTIYWKHKVQSVLTKCITVNFICSSTFSHRKSSPRWTYVAASSVAQRTDVSDFIYWPDWLVDAAQRTGTAIWQEQGPDSFTLPSLQPTWGQKAYRGQEAPWISWRLNSNSYTVGTLVLARSNVNFRGQISFL